MPRQYRTREGEATAVDTKTALTTLGSEASPGALMVPAGKAKLSGIYVATAPDNAATGGASAMVRLEGPGLPGGPEVIAAGSFGAVTALGGQMGHVVPQWIPLDVPVTPANEILVFGEMAGTDLGSIAFGVTLVFE